MNPLPYERHWRIAANFHPEREKRLICATGDDRDTTANGGPEAEQSADAFAEQAERRALERGGAPDVEDMRGVYGPQVMRVIDAAELDIESTLRAPAVKLILLNGDFLSDAQRSDLEERMREREPARFVRIHPKVSIPGRDVVDYLKRHPDEEQWFQAEVVRAIEDPQQFLTLCTELDARLLDYKHLDSVIKGARGLQASLGDITRIEAHLAQAAEQLQHQGIDMDVSDLVRWLAGEYDGPERAEEQIVEEVHRLAGSERAIRQTVRIEDVFGDTQRERRDVLEAKRHLVEFVLERAKEQGELDFVNGEVRSTKKGLLRRLREGVSRLFKWRSARQESGSIEDVEAQTKTLKKALDQHIQHWATQLLKNFKKRAETVLRKVDGARETGLDQYTKQHKLPSRALMRDVFGEGSDRLERMARMHRKGRQFSDQRLNPIEVDDEDDPGKEEFNRGKAPFLVYARDALGELGAIQTREPDPASIEALGFEQKLIEEAVERHENARAWAAEEAKSMRRLLRKIDALDGPTVRYLRKLLAQPDNDLTDEEFRELVDSQFRPLAALMQKFELRSDTMEDNELLDYELSGTWDRQKLSTMFRLLENDRVLRTLNAHENEWRERPEVANSALTRTQLEAQTDVLELQLLPNGNLTPRLHDHTVCTAAPPSFKQRFEQKFSDVRSKLQYAKVNPSSEESRESLKEAAWLIEELRTCNELVEELPAVREERNIKRLDSKTFGEITGDEKGYAFYAREDDNPDIAGRILLNQELIEREIERGTMREEDVQPLIEHEFGHAIMHTLTRKTNLFTGMLLRTYELRKDDVPAGDVRTFDTLLRMQAKLWGVEGVKRALEQRYPGDPQKVEDEYTDLLVEELLNQYATWVQEGKPAGGTKNFTDEEVILFRHLEPEQVEYGSVAINGQTMARAKENAGRRLQAVGAFQRRPRGGEEDNGGQQGPEAGGGDGGERNGGDGGTDMWDGEGEDEAGDRGEEGAQRQRPEEDPDLGKRIADLRASIDKIETFFESYPEYRGDLEPIHRNYDEIFAVIAERYADPDFDGGRLTEVINEIGQELAPVLKEIERLRTEKMNIQDAPVTGKKGLQWIFDHVNFMSINDFRRMFMQAGEDISRMWKRRGETVTAQTGEGLSGWIPSWIPYAGRLKEEYRKRAHSSELEEVNHWREAIKDRDNWLLEQDLGRVRNRDHLRAILEELSERGRLNWNYVPFWRTLNALSHYSMPIDACRNDDILRDKWIQKLITDIYGDKEHYFKWRQANDSGIESGKKKFTQNADQLANVSGGLAAELKRQLELYVTYKDTGNIPEEVNPHLYEEIIFYSIRNGKMTMEQKFFYLIQGIRWGLLSIDRLKAIAGEHGGVLNIFPFIDYFYQKNNTFDYIEKLGRRLEEGVHQRFTPGIKTSRFVYMEIARERRVKERLRKGTSKQGQNIDHDDIPYFLPHLDYSGIEDWYKSVHGGDQKLSKEAQKNSYIGFSIKFKWFATLAHLHLRGRQRFTQADLRDMAQTLSAYILSDNILSRNAYESKTVRPSLSRSEMYNQLAVNSNGRDTIGTYRDRLNEFAHGAVGKLFDPHDWETINDDLGLQGADRIDQDDYICRGPESVGRNEPSSRARKANAIFEARQSFTNILEQRILANPRRFLQLFQRISEQQGGEFFIEDWGQRFTNDAIEQMMEQQRKAA